MKSFLLSTLIISNFVTAGETFKNNNNTANETSFRDFVKWTFTGKNPKRVQIETSEEWKNLDKNSSNYAIWIGHATYLVDNGDLTILTDPVFSKRVSPFLWFGPRRLISPAMSIKELPKIDVITLSHNHYDHLDISSLKEINKLNPDASFLVPKGDKKLLVKSGIKNVKEFLWWENLKISETKFTFTPVQHWSARGLRDRNKSLWGGWFINSSSKILYHAGDTGYSDDFKETKLRLGSPDYAFIPIGAYDPQWFMSYSHVNPSEAVQIAKDLGATNSFAMHWGTFILTDEDVLEPFLLLEQEIRALNLPKIFFRAPKPGELISLSEEIK